MTQWRAPGSMGKREINGIFMKTLPGPFLAPARRLMMVAALMAVSLSFGANGAKAQIAVDLSTDNVTVDLSVIGDSGGSAAAGTPYLVRPSGSGVRRGLLVPGRRNPVSQLHVAVPKSPRIKLRPPGKGKKATKRVARKKPRPAKPKPKKPAMPAVAATKPPAPLTAPVAPPPMPAKPAEKTAAAKTAPPAPPPVKKPEVKKPAPPPPAKVAKKAPEPKPAPKPKPVAAAKPKPKEQAALPPKETIKTGRALQIAFGTTASKLSSDAKDGLKNLAQKLKDKKNLRLQLMAFAGSKSLSPSKARRMSLSRALSVRSFLIENGVRSTRIDVRALGSKTSEKPLNRVDVNIVER
jgi:outer membrane protein OmpA-like peptidoglycan-associated protein